MNVVKMGTAHKQVDMNCQDATASLGNRLRVVCDGCSEGKHSEVGAKLFCKVLINKYAYFLNKGKDQIDVVSLMMSTMDELVKLFGDDPQDIKDYLSFTTLVAEKNPEINGFYVYYCGDGYVIENRDGQSVSFQKLDCGEYPMYLAYNYISENSLKAYGTGVKIGILEFCNCYNIGVASDGIRFVADMEDENPLKKEFKEILLGGKDMKMKLFFNRNSAVFQDDFSIVF